MAIAEIRNVWELLSEEQTLHQEEAAKAVLEKRQAFLAWLHANPGYLARLRGHRSMRGVARSTGINHAYIARFEAGDLGCMSDAVVCKLFDTYTRYEGAHDGR